MNRWLLLPILLLYAVAASAQAPVITQSAPVVNQGATLQFTETLSEPGTWACAGTDASGNTIACHGSITAGGFYTAPASVTAQHSFGGYQLLPNNHIFNTRIDSQPLCTVGTCTATDATLRTAATANGGNPNWAVDFPVNKFTPATACTDTMNFFYTTGNNGSFEVPCFPLALAENGWFRARHDTSTDHHVLMLDTQTGLFSEFYQYYAQCNTSAASVTSNVATLTCVGNPQTLGWVVGDTVQVGSFTGGDTYFNGGPFTLTAVTSTSISYALTHANASATSNGSVTFNTAGAACSGAGTCNSQSGLKYQNTSYALPSISTDAAGMELQPLLLTLQELENAVANGLTINHAMRNTFALAAMCNCKLWPATTNANDPGSIPFGVRARLKASFDISTFSAIAKVLLTQLKQYGMIAADGGNNWPMNAEATRWPKAYYDALTEVSNAAIATNIEFVDQSSLQPAATNQTCPVLATCGLTKVNREIITFTRTSDSATASVDIALQGPAINLPNDFLYIMAGTPAQQLTCLVNMGGCTWSMSPSVGTLTSGGLYTPPATVGSATTTTITASSTLGSNFAAQMTVTIFPATGIRAIPSQTADYTDSFGNVWSNRTGVNWPDNQGCCSCDNQASFAAATDNTLWKCQVGDSSVAYGDGHMDFLVPNGPYQLTYNFGTIRAIGADNYKLSIGSGQIYPQVDLASIAGGQFKRYSSVTKNVVVTNNQLQFEIWKMTGDNAPVSSLSIIPGSVGAAQGRLP